MRIQNKMAAISASVIPDAKNPVNQKSSQEAENHIWPGVPGIQLHETRSVQVQILKTEIRKKCFLLKRKKKLEIKGIFLLS